MYEAEDAEIYDLVHEGRGKDYAAESKTVIELILDNKPGAASLLDVACGTAGHLACFAEQFTEVEGLDVSEDMLVTARKRAPGARFHLGDMRDFDLGRTFDAVTCLFASVGHMRSTGELAAALRTFARHTAPGGVVVVDPWWFPETFIPGYIAADVVEAAGRTVARISHSSVEGDATRMDVHYLVADIESGIRHIAESTLITLFTRAEYEAAFEQAGLTPTYIEGGLAGRGLFVGVRRSDDQGAGR
ncbi:class I SAM-dependent methyltransferase [Actinomadura rudentiformis]|uniref:Class I SAM-dependent methyltransferase n=1 Tax=Actinomadura rudentiformis TaxID=359158 RepID=A0A6H9YB46_9ACTN|nr:class I SAM-dependent methyltransferase [Actinomadura rudentiformis]KAB2340337.1 class I SAM-dependent methyltransferase [Actinomadura rudentiformis]